MKLKLSLLLAALCFLSTTHHCSATATKRLIYGLDNNGSIYYLDDNQSWQKLQDIIPGTMVHIAAGPNGQFYVIHDGLKDTGLVSQRANVTATNPEGATWEKDCVTRYKGSTKVTPENADSLPTEKFNKPVLKVAAGAFQTIVLTDASTKDNASGQYYRKFEFTPHWHTLIYSAIPRSTTMSQYFGWLCNIYQKRERIPYLQCIYFDPAFPDKHLREMKVSLPDGVELVQLAAAAESVLGVSDSGRLFFCSLQRASDEAKSKYKSEYMATEHMDIPSTIWSEIQLPSKYDGSDTLPVIAAGMIDDNHDEIWLCQKRMRSNVPVCLLWRRTEANSANPGGSDWELVYDSSKQPTDQQIFFKEIAVGSVEFTQEELDAITKAAEDAKAAEEARVAAEQERVQKAKQKAAQKAAAQKVAKEKKEAARKRAQEKAAKDAKRTKQLRDLGHTTAR